MLLLATLLLVLAPQPPVDTPQLHCKKTVVDWGTLIQGDEYDCVFELENRGQAPLKIQSIQSSCGCAAATSAEVIPPGGREEVRVHLKSITLNGDAVEKSLVVVSNHPGPPLKLTIRGRVVPLLTQKPKNLALQAFPGEPLALQVELQKGSPLAVELLSLQPQQGLAKVTYECTKPGESYRVNLVAEPKQQPTRRVDVLLARVRTERGEQTLKIPYAVTVLDWIDVSPRSLIFASKETSTLLLPENKRDAKLTQKVLITAQKPGALISVDKVNIVKAPPGAFSAKVREVEAGRRYEIVVSAVAWQRFPRVRSVLEVFTRQGASAEALQQAPSRRHIVNLNAQYRR